MDATTHTPTAPPSETAAWAQLRTEDLFRADSYLRECTATVLALTPQGVVLDRTVFYPLGGGQAGDSGQLVLPDGRTLDVSDTRKFKNADGQPTSAIAHVLANPEAHGLQPGMQLTARIDWERRHRLMRLHTTTHLLCQVVQRLVNGCSVTADAARLDFDMTEPLDKAVLTDALRQLVQAAHPVTVGCITDAELDAQPELIKSMSVSPPRGTGSVRTIRIGAEPLPAIDLQPCGGTHVRNTAEIGAVLVTKIEKKSASTRRVVLGFAPA